MRTRPIQPRPLGDCRLMVVYLAADGPALQPFLQPLKQSGAQLDVRVVSPRQPFAPGWLSPAIQSVDRVIVAWSNAAAQCPVFDQLDATSGALYRHRLFIMRLDETVVPAHLERFMLPGLRAALSALGSGPSRTVPKRLAHSIDALKRIRRWSRMAFAFTIAAALGALLIQEPPLLRFMFIAPAFLGFGTGVLLGYWGWINRRYHGQRIALLLADREQG